MLNPDGFAQRLDIALRARKVGKMYALAVALGIDESALSRWRRGKSISIDNLVRLSGHLRISIDWLLVGIGSMDAPGAGSAPTWQSKVVADLSALDPMIRDRLADLACHLAEARRCGIPEPFGWTRDPRADGTRPRGA